MQTTDVLDALASEYGHRGWTVESSAIGLELVTDDNVCGIELPAAVADDVLHFLRVHLLVGPVIQLPRSGRRIILAAASKKAALALTAMRAYGATIHFDGARIPLPPTYLLTGPVRWHTTGATLPPIVAVSAALRSSTTSRWGAALAS